MKKVIGYCREGKIGELVGDVLATNTRMLALARDLGFEITASEDPSVVRTKLALAAAATA
jgi:acetyltransferase